MATALYGVPVGLMAAEEQANKTAITQVQAERMMGELAEIPSSIRLKNAQAENFESLAAARGAENADAALMARYEAEARAKALSQGVAATEGRDANVEDLAGASPKVSSPLEQLYQHMAASGAPSRLLLPLADKIASIQQHEATAAYRAGQAKVQDLTAQATLAAQVGSMAGAAMASPEGYAQMRLIATQQGAKLPPEIKKIIDTLPQDWNAAKRILAPIAERALTVKDQIELQMKKIKAEQDEKTAKATQARAYASADLAKVRVGLVKEQITKLKKAGGVGTAEDVAAKEMKAAADYQKAFTQRVAEFPLLPADPSKVQAGRAYTIKDGRVARAKVLADGSVGFEEMMPALPKPPAARTLDQIRKEMGSTVSVGDDEEDD